MPKYREHDKDIIRVLTRRINELERRIKHIESNPYTTIPKFSVIPPEYPDPTPEGLIFISGAHQLRFFSDGTLYNVGP